MIIAGAAVALALAVAVAADAAVLSLPSRLLLSFLLFLCFDAAVLLSHHSGGCCQLPQLWQLLLVVGDCVIRAVSVLCSSYMLDHRPSHTFRCEPKVPGMPVERQSGFLVPCDHHPSCQCPNADDGRECHCS